MERRKRSAPLLLKIIIPMIALSVLQILIIVTVMSLNGEFTLIKRFSYNSLSEKTENRGSYVENVLNRKTTPVRETAEAVSAAVDALLAERGLSAEAIARDKELNKRILSDNVEKLISLIRADAVNDAFLFLNSGDLYESGGVLNAAGIYLRDTDVNSQSAAGSADIYMETGNSEIARAFGMPLDYGWTLYWDVTDRENERNRFYYEAIESVGRYPGVAPERLGSWSGFAGVADSSSDSMKYTVPLVSADGTVYGVLGIGLLKKTVLQDIPSSDFFDESACYILAVDPEGDGDYREMLSSGPAYSRLVDGDTALNKSRPLEYGMYDFTSHSADCIGIIRDLRLYAADSPYRTQKWALISVADEGKTLEIHYMLIRVFLVSMTVSLAAGILFALLVSKSISSPVTKMMGELENGRRNNALVNFSSSGISEIDGLAASITELQSEAIEYGSRVSRIITMAGGGIGVFLYDLRRRNVFVGEGLAELLGLSDFPSGETTVSLEEFRERLGEVDHENRLFEMEIFGETEPDDAPNEKSGTAEKLEFSRIDPETGETVWLEFRLNRDGSRIVGLVQDITGVVAEKQRIARGKDDEYTEKLIKANAALRDAYAVAKRANSAKTDFLSRMSHDIRTPMNAIIGMTAIAQMRLDDKERLADCLGKIESSSRYLLSLINGVLDMSKIESGKFVLNEERFRISELVGAVVEMIRPAVNAKGHQFYTGAEGIAHERVIGDHVRIRQAFVNILSNAVKYTPEGGRIEFTATEKPTPETGVGCYEFVFRDSGIGMTKEFLDRLYEPFERASDVRVDKEQGTGLGMAITKNIVEMMNGGITVESEPGKGTTFTVMICLKLWEEESAPAPEEQSAAESLGALGESDFSGIRALLVDDNALNLEIAQEILQMTGLTIETAVDGKDAFDRFAASPEGYYGIVFMDVQMPVMNGYEATAAIRALSRGDAKTVPIVAMTANAFAEDVRAAKEAGMDEHIAKPLDFERLKEVLNQRLRKQG